MVQKMITGIVILGAFIIVLNTLLFIIKNKQK